MTKVGMKSLSTAEVEAQEVARLEHFEQIRAMPVDTVVQRLDRLRALLVHEADYCQQWEADLLDLNPQRAPAAEGRWQAYKQSALWVLEILIAAEPDPKCRLDLELAQDRVKNDDFR